VLLVATGISIFSLSEPFRPPVTSSHSTSCHKTVLTMPRAESVIGCMYSCGVSSAVAKVGLLVGRHVHTREEEGLFLFLLDGFGAARPRAYGTKGPLAPPEAGRTLGSWNQKIPSTGLAGKMARGRPPRAVFIFGPAVNASVLEVLSVPPHLWLRPTVERHFIFPIGIIVLIHYPDANKTVKRCG
jgi:hypothetical protein